jgi:hypothetical protein
MNGRTWFPVSSGILTPEHINRIGAAVWVFLWMVHHEHKPKGAKENIGLVNGGGALTCNRIGGDLGIPAETCRRHLATLVSRGYIRAELLPGLGKRYYIANPIRWELGASKSLRGCQQICTEVSAKVLRLIRNKEHKELEPRVQLSMLHGWFFPPGYLRTHGWSL